MRTIQLTLTSGVITLLLGALLAGCSGPTVGPQEHLDQKALLTPSSATATPVMHNKANPSSPLTVTPQAAPTTPVAPSGELIFKSNCGTCHSLPSTDQLRYFPSDIAMADWIKSMAQLARLSADETQKVLDYTLALRRGGR